MLVSAMVSARTSRILGMMTGAFGSVIYPPMSKTVPAAAPFPFDPVPNARNGWFKVGGELRWGRWSTKDSKKVRNPALLLQLHHTCTKLCTTTSSSSTATSSSSTYFSSTSSFSNPFCRSLFLDRPNRLSNLMLEARSPFCCAFSHFACNSK